MIDVTKTQYIDFDVLELIKEFKNIKAPEKNIACTLVGFKEEYKISNTENVQSEKLPNPVEKSTSHLQAQQPMAVS